jgi:hypothetical protein
MHATFYMMINQSFRVQHQRANQLRRKVLMRWRVVNLASLFEQWRHKVGHQCFFFKKKNSFFIEIKLLGWIFAGQAHQDLPHFSGTPGHVPRKGLCLHEFRMSIAFSCCSISNQMIICAWVLQVTFDQWRAYVALRKQQRRQREQLFLLPLRRAFGQWQQLLGVAEFCAKDLILPAIDAPQSRCVPIQCSE